MVGGLKHMPRDLEVKSCAKGIAQQLGYFPHCMRMDGETFTCLLGYNGLLYSTVCTGTGLCCRSESAYSGLG